MNFFEAQDRSRRNSRKLVLLFAIATIAIASAIAIVVELAFFQVFIEGQPGPFQSPVRMLLKNSRSVCASWAMPSGTMPRWGNSK